MFTVTQIRRCLIRFALTALCLVVCPFAWPQGKSGADSDLSRLVIGGEFHYTTKKGDYLARIASRFGTSDRVLSAENGLAHNRVMASGETVRVINRHIVPEPDGADIVINLPQRMLFLFEDGKLEAAYPVGLGKHDWPTPTGKFRILNRQENKPWIVPKSIQEEMAREGKTVLTEVPPGPKNPLGKHWLGLSLPGIGIHGTIAPVSVYRFRSHGCIRMHPDDINALFDKAEVGMNGKAIYATVLMAKLADGRVFLEVNPDIYKKAGDPMKLARRLAEDHALTERIDWQKAAEVVRLKDGLATDVTKHDAAQKVGRNKVWLDTSITKTRPAEVF